MNLITLQAPAAGGGITNTIFMVAIVAVFYIFMILPQMRKSKKQKAFIEALGTGDQIITTSGMHGKITKLEDTTAIIELEDKQKVKIERSAISMELSAALKAKA